MEDNVEIDKSIHFIDTKFTMTDFNASREYNVSEWDSSLNIYVTKSLKQTINEWIIWTIKKAKKEIEKYNLSKTKKDNCYPRTTPLDIKRICYLNVSELLKFQNEHIGNSEDKNRIEHTVEPLLNNNNLSFDYKNKHKINKFKVGSYDFIFSQQELTSLKYQEQIDNNITPQSVFKKPLKNKHQNKDPKKYKYQNPYKIYQSFKNN